MTTQLPTAEQIRDAWDAIAPGFDDFVTPQAFRLGEDVLGRIDVRPGMRILDVAAGSGAVAIPAARQGVRVVAVDIAATMIERLRARADAEGLSNLEGRVMDGQALEVEDDSFDAAVSLNGVSLFPDLGGGLAELARVVKPGGRALVGAFGPPSTVEFLGFLIGALQAVVPGFAPPPMDPPPLPFQLADPNRLRRELAGAGLTGVTADVTTWDLHFESATHLWNTFTSGNPVWVRLIADLTQDQRAEVQRVLDGMFRERSGGGPQAQLHAEINIGIGTK